MKKIMLKALKSHVYAGKRRAVGDEFEARTSSDARILMAVRLAERSQQAVEPAPPVVAPVAEPEVRKPRRRRYSRRDMTAE